MYRLEMKRLAKTRSTWILSAAALLLSVIIGLSTIFSVVSYVDFTIGGDSVSVQTLTGFEAIKDTKEKMSHLEGELTRERIEQMLDESEKSTESGVYDSGVETVLGALGRVGGGDVADYYDARKAFIERNVEEKYGEDAAETALKIDEGTTEPFYYEYGHGDSDAIVNLSMCQSIIAAVCAAISSAAFVQGYATGADDIMRCTRHGRGKFANVKLLSAVSYAVALYIVCSVVFTAIVFAAFGSDASAAQLKGNFNSPLVLLGITEDGEYFLNVLMGLLTTLAVTAFALWVSAIVKSPVLAFAAAVGMVLLPLVCTTLFADSVWGMWAQNLLPSGGVCVTTGLWSQLTASNFLLVGSLAIWTPFAMLAAPVIEAPVFALLAKRAYVRHEG